MSHDGFASTLSSRVLEAGARESVHTLRQYTESALEWSVVMFILCVRLSLLGGYGFLCYFINACQQFFLFCVVAAVYADYILRTCDAVHFLGLSSFYANLKTGSNATK